MFKRILTGAFFWTALLAAVSCGPRGKATIATVVPDDSAQVATVVFPDICVLSQDARVPVIMYHDVIAARGPSSVWFDTTAAEFEAQLQTLKDRGAVPISLDQLYEHLTKGKLVPSRAIVLTFDDNYQGYYDNAIPILRKFGYPSAMFVHTKYVGDKSGSHPKMGWDTLKELVKDPLVTIGSHTVTHPADIRQVSPDDQRHELVDSKSTLEKELGRGIDYLAYPDGMNDPTVQAATNDAGYKMAFSIDNVLAEDSPNILCVGRYVATRLERAVDDQDRETVSVPSAVVITDIRDGPVTLKSGTFAGVRLATIVGGTPQSLRSPGRQTVGDFVKQSGAVAGINGTFFSLASISGTDNGMVGPVETSNEKAWVPDDVQERWPKTQDRPMVVWGPKRMAFFPFQPPTMNDGGSVKAFMPDMTDAFVAGAWIVHDGVAQTSEQMDAHSSKDIHDPRHRAFFGLMRDGMVVLGASLSSVTTEAVAKAAAEAGVQEAVLLDSGFSTSLLFGDDVIASGHSSTDNPSRPVPHAIVLIGQLGQRIDLPPQPGDVNPDEAAEAKVHARRRKKRHSPTTESDADRGSSPNTVPLSDQPEDQSKPDAEPSRKRPTRTGDLVPDAKKRTKKAKGGKSNGSDAGSVGGVIPPK